MKKNIAIILWGAILIIGMLACSVTFNGEPWGETVRGSGKVVEQDREVNDVTGVALEMQGTLYIEMGSSTSLRVEAEDNLLEYIQTEVNGGMLRIKTRQNANLDTREPIKFYLTVSKLDEIQITSSGDVESEALQAEDFTILVSSSGDLKIASLDCDTLEVSISSSGDVDILEGSVPSQKIKISSSGDYNARNLASQEADVELSSSGQANIRVSQTLNGDLSSSGSIHYYGDPDVDVSTSSSGEAVKEGK